MSAHLILFRIIQNHPFNSALADGAEFMALEGFHQAVHVRAIHAFRLVAATLEHADGLFVLFLTRRRYWCPLVHHVAPLVAEVDQRSDIRLPRLHGKIVHVIRGTGIVVFIGQSSKAMTELMDDDIAGETIAARAGTIEIVYPAAAVFLRIDKDINLVVWNLSGQVADVAIVGAHAITLRIESPKTETHGRILVNVVTRHSASAFFGSHHHAAHVETLTVAVVGCIAEQTLHEKSQSLINLPISACV